MNNLINKVETVVLSTIGFMLIVWMVIEGVIRNDRYF